jgi:hypothetical protein
MKRCNFTPGKGGLDFNNDTVQKLVKIAKENSLERQQILATLATYLNGLSHMQGYVPADWTYNSRLPVIYDIQRRMSINNFSSPTEIMGDDFSSGSGTTGLRESEVVKTAFKYLCAILFAQDPAEATATTEGK